MNEPFLVPTEVETTEIKKSEINNVFRLVQRQDLRAGRCPTSSNIVNNAIVS